MLRSLILLLSVTYCASEPSVIIIGAGPSGIAAATRLLKNGVTGVTVLEAENRIGGRVHSVPFVKDNVDLGAEWCHGEKGNVVYEMVKELDLLRPGRVITIPQVTHSKHKVLDQNFSTTLIGIMNEILEESHEVSGSLGDHLIERYEEEISQWKNEPEKYAIAKQAVELLESFTLSLEGPFSWFELSALTDFVESEGNPNLNWNGHGYKTVLELMMQKYPDASKSLPIDDKILLNKEVEQIFWDSDKTVVKCADGSSYTADHVIVTVSLGVLKHQHDTLFVPKLPADKTTAIEQLGIAAVHKIFLHFPEKWWNDTYTSSCFVWDKDAYQFKEGPIKNGKSWVTGMSVIVRVPHNPNVLTAWVSGPFVPDVEKLSDETVINGVMHLLQYFAVAGSKTIVRPDKIAREKWYTNPHFRGTYSYQTVRSRRGALSDEVILAAPLGSDPKKPNLLFAGEASNPTHFSTVHGAIETGFREADRIIKMYK